jgi:hypothetical protein
VFLVDTREEVDGILADDPYYRAPGVAVAAVQEWRTVTRHPAVADL